MTKSNQEVAISWIMRIKRLVYQKDYNSAHSNIKQLLKLCEQHGFTEFKIEAELLHTQIYTELGDYSQAMALITKIIGSLENQDGSFNNVRL